MKLIRSTSARLFKGTVVLLGLPAVLLPAIASVLILARLGRGWPQVGSFSFAFAFTRLELATVAGALLGAFIFLYVLGKGVARRYRGQKSGINP